MRLGTPELVRIGMKAKDMPAVASLIARSLDTATDSQALAVEVAEFRSRFSGVHYTVDNPS